MAIGSAHFSDPAEIIATSRYWSNKLRYVDMNATNGGVARGTAITTSWTDVFSYTGSGALSGFILNIETFTTWKIRLVIDSTEEIFGSDGIISDEIQGDLIYDLDDVTDVTQSFIGLSKGSHDRIVFTCPNIIPIKFSTKIEIKLARVSGGTKKFQAGLIILQKDS